MIQPSGQVGSSGKPAAGTGGSTLEIGEPLPSQRPAVAPGSIANARESQTPFAKKKPASSRGGKQRSTTAPGSEETPEPRGKLVQSRKTMLPAGAKRADASWETRATQPEPLSQIRKAFV